LSALQARRFRLHESAAREKDTEMDREQENIRRKIESSDGVEKSEPSTSLHSSSSNNRPGALILRKPLIIVIVVLLIVLAAAVTFWLRSGSSSQAGRPVPAPTGEPVPSPSESGAQPRPGEITITLTPDELQNAQIKTEPVTVQSDGAGAAAGPHTVGTVQANAYKEVPILPVAGGIVREVNAQLGDRVRRGQTLAVVFSSELAEAQSEYLKMVAELEEHHKHHLRATELVEIGAMSREDLEGALSKYKTAQANVSSARQRLLLLGMSAKEIDALRPDQVRSLVSVPAPASGTVISRTVNPGEVVMTGKELFRVADLSSVWVMGQVYESDFAKVRVGTPAVITTTAYPDRTFMGKVSYIDPKVDPQTRTAQVRVELANPNDMLKLGMFVDVSFGDGVPVATSGQPSVAVPRAAVQSIGSKHVVFAATDQQGVFVQREVNAGPEINGHVTIYTGLSSGDRVVTEGAFLLRAESLKLNPTQSTASSVQSAQPQTATTSPIKQSTRESDAGAGTQNVTIAVTKDGFTPESFTVRKNLPVRLTFVRKVEATCATDVVIADYDIKRELPLNEPVVIEFTPEKAGTISFACGMNMQRGRITVR
jgi:RND family efflux transporter MFP subunit